MMKSAEQRQSNDVAAFLRFDRSRRRWIFAQGQMCTASVVLAQIFFE